MGGATPIGPFAAHDSFLRRISRPSAAKKDGTVGRRAFEARQNETSLSFTFQDETLKSSDGLDAYHIASKLPSGDLPAICFLTNDDLCVQLAPPLPPWHAPDPQDSAYGHLHCSTDLPVDQLHKEKIAWLATRNGLLRTFRRR